MVYVTGYTSGSRAHYGCDEGFRLVGVGWRECSNTCVWTDYSPKCIGKACLNDIFIYIITSSFSTLLQSIAITCPDLENQPNGSVYVTGDTPGSRANYQCDAGFILVGPTSRQCQPNGTWTGETPSCSRKLL